MRSAIPTSSRPCSRIRPRSQSTYRHWAPRPPSAGMAAKQGLSAGDIVLGAEYRIYYDGTDFLLVPPGAVPLPSDFVEQRRLSIDLSAGKPLDFFEGTVFWDRDA